MHTQTAGPQVLHGAVAGEGQPQGEAERQACGWGDGHDSGAGESEPQLVSAAVEATAPAGGRLRHEARMTAPIAIASIRSHRVEASDDSPCSMVMARPPRMAHGCR